MTEPLEVDTSRLKAAGNTLRGLAFPAVPPPIVAPGTDSVSTAINATLPVIEGPVVDGLPAVEAAVTRTGSSIVIAADMYAETDQTLAKHVGKVHIPAAGDGPPGRASAEQLTGAAADEPSDGETPAAPDPALQPAAPVFDQLPMQLGQVAAMAGAVAPVTQNAQTIMSAVQGAAGSTGGAAPAQPPAAEADATEEQPPESVPEGAASGAGASEGAPVEPTSPARPEPAPSEL